MDPIAISGLLVIVILLAAAAFGIYNRKKGAPVGIKIDPVKRAERQAKRKARRQEIIEDAMSWLMGNPNEAHKLGTAGILSADLRKQVRPALGKK